MIRLVFGAAKVIVLLFAAACADEVFVWRANRCIRREMRRRR